MPGRKILSGFRPVIFSQFAIEVTFVVLAISETQRVFGNDSCFPE